MPRQFIQRIEVLIHFSAREMASRTAALLLLGVAAPPSLALHATRALHVSSCVRPHLRAHPAPQLHGGRRLDDRGPPRGIGAATSLPALLALFAAAPAEAAAPNAIPSALAAYGHYLGLVLVALCLATERLTIKAGMSAEEEQRMAIADSVYGLAGLLVLATGYLRVTQYGKGWEFYAHEPVFWVKLVLVSV